jgi:predicted nucleic acid-binding protein
MPMNLMALKDVKLLFLDTAPIIYYVENNPRYFAIVEPIFNNIDNGLLNVVTSPITLAECLVFPYRTQSTLLEKTFCELITQSENTLFIPTNEVIAQQAAKLRNQYNLSLTDALQISSAIITKCDGFLTNDIDLKKIKEINVIVIEDFILLPSRT